LLGYNFIIALNKLSEHFNHANFTCEASGIPSTAQETFLRLDIKLGVIRTDRDDRLFMSPALANFRSMPAAASL
jgi:hypothetical protein